MSMWGFRSSFAVLGFLVLGSSPAFAETVQAILERVRPSIVKVKVQVSIPLHGDTAGRSFGTGTVVDPERGLLLTNAHVSTRSPGQVMLQFVNGKSVPGIVVYTDPLSDYAFVRFDPSSLNIKFPQIHLGSVRSVKVGNSILMITNEAGLDLTPRVGEIQALGRSVRTNENRHMMALQISMGSVGGSSGASVFDENGDVIGLNYAGIEGASNFAIPIDYVKEALRALQASKNPVRGDLGVELSAEPVGDAENYQNFPAVRTEELQKKFPGARELAIVQKVVNLPGSENPLQVGDIVWSVEGQIVAHDFMEFDQALDAAVSNQKKSVSVGVIRLGRPLTYQVPVSNAVAERPSRVIRFQGAIFHDISISFRLKYNYSGDGVLMTSTDEGAPFSGIGANSDNKHSSLRAVVIRAVNGSSVMTATDLAKILKGTDKGGKIHVSYMDMAATYTGIMTGNINLDRDAAEIGMIQLPTVTDYLGKILATGKTEVPKLP